MIPRHIPHAVQAPIQHQSTKAIIHFMRLVTRATTTPDAQPIPAASTQLQNKLSISYAEKQR